MFEIDSTVDTRVDRAAVWMGLLGDVTPDGLDDAALVDELAASNGAAPSFEWVT